MIDEYYDADFATTSKIGSWVDVSFHPNNLKEYRLIIKWEEDVAAAEGGVTVCALNQKLIKWVVWGLDG